MDSEAHLRLLYQDELHHLRKDGARFAQRHPRIAAHLGLQAADSRDPFVERLLESVAWMAAGLRADMDERLPEVSRLMLGQLYPNFCAPLPSISIATFTPALQALQGQEQGFVLPAHSNLHCPGQDGTHVIRWRTAWPVRLHGASVREVHVEALAGGATRLRLRMQGLQGLRLPELRFFLRGERFSTFPLHDWLLSACTEVRLEASPSLLGRDAATNAPADATASCSLGRKDLQAVGLSPEEYILPRGQYSLPGYQLMQEYFAFPERFLFWRLKLHEQAHDFMRQQALTDICFYLDSLPPRQLHIRAEHFDCCATPIVNLFTRLAEPLLVDHSRDAYPLVCDQRREDSTEVYAILSVKALEAEGSSTDISPYFSLNATGAATNSVPQLYWHERRNPAAAGAGSDVHLFFKDMRTPLHRARPFTVLTRILCTNRGKATELRQPVRLSPDCDLPAENIGLCLPPSPQHQPAIFGGELWKLVSHLTLHKLSLSGAGAQGLREILRLYAPSRDAYAQRQISGIREVRTEALIQPLRQQLGGVARGSRFDVELDEEAFYGVSPLIFGEVLNVFLGLYASLNTLTQVRLHSSSRQGLWYEWPPRSGMWTV